MKHSKLLALIKESTGITPKQKDLAAIINKPLGTINSRASRDLSYTQKELDMIEDYFKIGLTNKCFFDDMHDNSGEISVDYYPEVLASCGGGTFELSQFKEKIKIPRMAIKHYFPLSTYTVINAYGDSMTPTIQNGDKLIVEMVNNDAISDNSIYIFVYDDKIFCKRLIQNIDNVVVISDNKDKEIYPTKTIYKEDMNNIHLVGKIVGLMRSM